MTMDQYEKDPRFQDIGDLPTGYTPYDFKEMYVREFSLAELKLVYVGMHSRTKPVHHLIRAVQMCCSVDVKQLTDGDFEFVMAWLRMHSYPKAPLQVNWSCRHENFVYKDDRTFYRGAPLTYAERAVKGIVPEVCNTNNVEIVHKYKTKVESLDDDNLYIKDEDIDFPRVVTLPDFHEHILEFPEDRHMAECARWVKKGSTFKAKFIYLNSRKDNDLYERILDARKEYHHGIIEVMHLRCRVCDHEWSHTTAPRLLSFFADNTEEDIFKIKYTMLNAFGWAADANIPAKEFLFNYSSLAKDRQDAAERRGGYKPLG